MSKETIVTVITNNGPVIGRKRANGENKEFYSFQGIPFAKPPIGELRFKDPQPVDNWTEPHDGTVDCPAPFIMNMFTGDVAENSTEDCLRLNIYVQNLDANQKRPVMIWIYGGGFLTGSSSEDECGPQFLIERDIVLVTFNYRVGALGFLSIDDKAAGIPGNAGLKDQTMAIRWATANAHHFGGNAKNVTLFGNSAGGASVHYQLTSPFAAHAFHKAIIQSGSRLNPWANRPAHSDINERLARKLGWDGINAGDMLAVLREANAADIVRAQDVVTEAERQNGRIVCFVPTVEPYDDGNCMIDGDYLRTYKTAWGNHIPLLIGGNNGEGYLMYCAYASNERMFDDNGYFENAIPWEMGAISAAERVGHGERLKRFYYGADERPSLDNLDRYAALAGDRLFWHGIYAAARARVEADVAAPTYMYRFNFDSNVIDAYKMMLCGKRVKGSIHVEESLYLIRMKGKNDGCMVANSAEERIKELMLNIWTSFAATGNPNCKETEQCQWQPLANDAPFKGLNIDEEPTFTEMPENERIAVWDSIYRF